MPLAWRIWSFQQLDVGGVGVRTQGRRCDGCNMMANISSITLGPNNLMLQLGGGNFKSKISSIYVNTPYVINFILVKRFKLWPIEFPATGVKLRTLKRWWR